MSYHKLLTDLASLESPRTKPYAPWRDPGFSAPEFLLFIEEQELWDRELICRFYGLGGRRAENLREIAAERGYYNAAVARKHLNTGRRTLRRAIDRYLAKTHGPAPEPARADRLEHAASTIVATEQFSALLAELRADFDRFSSNLDRVAAMLELLPPGTSDGN